MWGLLPRGRQVLIIVSLTLILWKIMQIGYTAVDRPPQSLAQAASSITSAISIVLLILANFLWRKLWKLFPILNKWVFPDLNGVWEGHLQTTWIDPSTGAVPAPIPSTVTIKQTLFDIDIRQTTRESTSYSNNVIAEADTRADRYRIWYSYSNQPKACVSHRSNAHTGVCWLEINLLDDQDKLEGQYFTSRRSSGDMLLTKKP